MLIYFINEKRDRGGGVFVSDAWLLYHRNILKPPFQLNII